MLLALLLWMLPAHAGWWTAYGSDGRVLGETRYEDGAPVAGLRAPPERPRCLANPPPDGLYDPPDGAKRCDADAPPGCISSPLARPVAVVGGCVGTTPSGDDTIGVTARDRFVVVHRVGVGCTSGVTAAYQATSTGLDGQAQSWTACGSPLTRDGEARPLERKVLDDAPTVLLGDGRPAVRAAALEALAAQQPTPSTCAPLGRAIHGAYGANLADRAMQIAAEPCLADALRDVLQRTHHPLAAAALARVTDDPGAAGGDLLAAVRAGDDVAAERFADRLVAMKAADPLLRDALAGLLLDPKGGLDQRGAASRALDRLFARAGDGTVLISARSRRSPCGGVDALFGLAAVKAALSGVPPSELAGTFKPLLGVCDPALDEVTGSLIGDLEQAGDTAPDAAWGVLATALARRPGPGWTDRFAGLGCEGALPANWGKHRTAVMEELRKRRCAFR